MDSQGKKNAPPIGRLVHLTDPQDREAAARLLSARGLRVDFEPLSPTFGIAWLRPGGAAEIPKRERPGPYARTTGDCMSERRFMMTS